MKLRQVTREFAMDSKHVEEFVGDFETSGAMMRRLRSKWGHLDCIELNRTTYEGYKCEIGALRSRKRKKWAN